MEKLKNIENEVILCGCCGRSIRHNKKENVDYGLTQYPCDIGYGTCVSCGEYMKIKIKNGKTKLGKFAGMFYQTRFSIIRNNLSRENQKKWDGLSLGKKIVIVYKLIEKGVII